MIDVEIERVKLMRYISDRLHFDGITNVVLANLSSIDPSNVCRILKGRYSPTVDVLLRLLAVGGYTLTIKKKID